LYKWEKYIAEHATFLPSNDTKTHKIYFGRMIIAQIWSLKFIQSKSKLFRNHNCITTQKICAHTLTHNWSYRIM